MSKDLQRIQSLLVVVALAAALTLPWLTRPFHTRGEPREALVAQSMLSTGNWVSPPAYDGAVPSKPPFSHWLIALASLPLGEVTEATSRLPSALAVILFSGAFFLFLSARVPLEVASGASLVLLASSEWFRGASTCRVDTLLATSMAGGLLSLYAWWERSYRGVPWLAIVLIACAALTKGPVGFVLPLGLFGLFCWAKELFSLKNVPAILLRLVILSVPVVVTTSIWYVLGYLERGDAFVEKIRYENFERFTSSMADEPHKHTSFYLIGMFVLGILPWPLCFIAAATPRRIRNWLAHRITKQNLRPNLRLESLRSWWEGQGSLYQFSLIVTLGILLFFCIPSSKRSVYLLPAYPFAALLLERELRRIAHERVWIFRWLERVITVFLGAIAIAAVVLFVTPIGGVSLDWEALRSSMTLTKMLWSLVIAALLIVVLRGPGKELCAEGYASLAIVVVTAVALVGFFVYDGVAWQLSPKRWVYGERLQRVIEAQQYPQLFSYGSEAYGASFYLKKPFSRATPGGVPSGSLVFLEERKLAECMAQVASNIEEVVRYSSGLTSPKQDVVVIRVR